MNGQQANRIISSILSSFESLIQSQVDHRNGAFLNELQAFMGSMFKRASVCLDNELAWAEYDGEGMDEDTSHCLH